MPNRPYVDAGHQDLHFFLAAKSAIPGLNTGYFILEILTQYNKPWRRYHNVNHVMKMLGLVSSHLKEDFDSKLNIKALECMIIFHDVIYMLNRPKGWNERASAEVARKKLREHSEVESGFIQLVEAGILATIDHRLDSVPEESHDEVSWLIDIDHLAGLGTTREEFELNSMRIAEELSPVFTAKEIAAGRANWASGLLSRDRIFLREEFSQYEEIARENLTRAAKIL